MPRRELSLPEWAARLQRLGPRPFTMPEARAIGVSRAHLTRLVGAGLLRSPFLGVYCLDDVPGGLAHLAQAAALVLPEGGAVARRTAAWMYDVDTRPPDERDRPMVVEAVVPRGVTPLRRPGLRCFSEELLPEDVIDVEGILCTTPTRTAVDLLR